jgi:hypothetical protein
VAAVVVIALGDGVPAAVITQSGTDRRESAAPEHRRAACDLLSLLVHPLVVLVVTAIVAELEELILDTDRKVERREGARTVLTISVLP